MNTYLFSKPSFASPQPLAAASGLTIPLQITLSEIKLSAFIILVFSRQKGLTLVFRNDPLESLKVSSTFDSIPFVRDYLQKTIEIQLRTLMMDELPAIIHRLSLRLWCPEYRAKEDEMAAEGASERKEMQVDPLASPPQDAVDARGNVLDASEISSLSLDGGSEIHSLFSQKNLLRLATLTDSHRTLSLFTPSIRDAVFRAWAGPSERAESAGHTTPATPSLTRSHSNLGSTSTTYTFSRGSDDGTGHLPSRPSLVSMHSATTGLSLGAGRHSRSHASRKKKNRVVNLRKSRTTDDIESESGDSETSSAAPASEPIMTNPIPEEPEDVVTPPHSPSGRVRFRTSSIDLGETPRNVRPSLTSIRPIHTMPLPVPEQTIPALSIEKDEPSIPIYSRAHRPSYGLSSSAYPTEKTLPPSLDHVPSLSSTTNTSTSTSNILNQAWVMKMASEIARRSQDDKSSNQSQPFWTSSASDREDTPPPAYQPKA